MPRIRFLLPTIGLAILAIALFSTCAAPVGSPGDSSGKGALSIIIGNNVNSRTLTPTLDMNVASYAISGTGPGGATFAVPSTTGSVNQTGLAFGSWTIVVNATNATGTLIGTGSAVAQVNTGATTAVAISVTPVSGNGSLALNVSWPAAQVQTPSINATLTPALGAAQTLPFAISGATASYSNSAVGNGYYTLAFTLNDNNIPVAGAVEVVRIVTGQPTSGSYAFANVNAPGGTLQVNVNANMQNPLSVAIAGVVANLPQGSTETLTASVSNYSGNVVYVWYVNGVSVGTGPSYVFGANTTVGFNYRIDVVAITADGTQAGSGTANVAATVASATPPPGVIGATWTARTLPSNQSWDAIVFGNGIYIAGTSNTNIVATSPDGINWTTRILPNATQCNSISYGNGTFVGVGGENSPSNLAVTSNDGITWTARTLPSYHSWNSITYGNGLFAAIAAGNVVATSPDGINWKQQTLPNFQYWMSITYGNGIFVAVGEVQTTNGVVGSTVAVTSPDGIVWTARTIPLSLPWVSVAYGNGTFVAISSQNSGVVTSPDGITWTSRTLPNSKYWSLTYGNGNFVALTSGTSPAAVVVSPDGISWNFQTLATLPTAKWWTSTTYGNGKFVAVATNSSVAATSP